MPQPVLQGPFTVETYQRLAELGVLHPDARVELIDGQIVEMSPIGDRHAYCVRRLNTLCAPLVPGTAIVDIQNTLVLGRRDAPQPDVTLLKPRADGYRKHPRADDTLLVIEVSDTTLAFDQGIKVPKYARAGVPEVWIVDLAGGRIGVHRRPRGDAYEKVTWATRGDGLTPLLVPHFTLRVEDILG